MTLHPGVTLGPYEIQSPLGAGGMGEVYQALDTRLGRVVAIKVLPGDVAADPASRERFDREAKVISSLNHRHICALYDVGHQDGIDFLVMEYLDGETLADRVARGRIPLDESISIASQIADALEAAHDKGIVHRDLKPANVKITSDGIVKVLDFGLARHVITSGSLHVSNSPTVMVTTPGIILGTAAYMSPEQAKGKEADRSADVWAFGCVLYEMLTGRRAFDGDTVSEILASVLKTEPPWHQLPAETPDGVRRLLRRSLQKNHKVRFRDIRDARLELADAQSATPEKDNVTGVRSSRGERLAWASALAIVATIAGVLGVRTLSSTPVAPETNLTITTPPTRDATLAISPDGLKVVFVAQSAGQSQLWLRLLDSPTARPLVGTAGASYPFWSPNSRSIGFFADAMVKRMNLDDGSIQTLMSAASGLGGAWNDDGTMILSTNPGTPILRVPAEGGESTAVTRFESPQQRSHSSPQFLPDRRHFLFFVTGSSEARGVYIGQLDSVDTKRLFDADTPAVYASNGQLLFVRDEKLLAQRFDPKRLEARGDAVPIAEHMNAGTALSASAAGPIVYRTPSPDSGQRQLVWIDRSGRVTDTEVYPDITSPGPALSHDGRRVALFRYANGNMDIWSYETVRRNWNRLTFDAGDDIFPLWSPDDSSIVFGSRRGGMNLYRKLLSGPPGSEELLLSTSEPKFPMDWSPDGHFLLYDSVSPKGGVDIWALPLEGREAFAVVQTQFNERLGQFSPDGKWIAYQSDKTGRFEIYVQPFPGTGGDFPVSTNGGTQVRWNPRGTELFYVAADDRLMAVPIRLPSNATTFEVGKPLWLSGTNIGGAIPGANRHAYMVAPDGRSFVINSVPEEAGASPITVIQNWKPRANN
jgi:eukaryotic-like serine/threonine-protein kinase